MPFLFGNEHLVVAAFFTFIIYLAKGNKLDRVVITYCVIFAVLFILQALAFNQFVLSKFLAYYLRIFYAYFTIKIVKDDIDVILINQIYFFCITSLIITLTFIIFPNTIDYAYDALVPIGDAITLNKSTRQHFVIYTMELGWQTEIARNSGPFWEPGGFGVFIYLAFIFNLIKQGTFFNKKNVIFILTLISTQSTTAYLAFFVFCSLYILLTKKVSTSFLLLPIIIVISISLYSSVDFLGMKIENMINDSQTMGKQQVYSRVVSGNVNVDRFLSSPIFGIGRFYVDEDDFSPGNNGTTLLLAEFGIIGFFFYFLYMFRSYRNYCEEHNFNTRIPIAIVAGWLVLGYSQGIFQKSFFFGLSFMFLVGKYAKHSVDYKITNFKKKFPTLINDAGKV